MADRRRADSHDRLLSFACIVTSVGALGLVGCTKRTPVASSSQHRCAQVNGADIGTSRGAVVCKATALGGTGNKSSAQADGEKSNARAVAGSLDLFDQASPGDYRSSDNNASLAVATHGADALARSGVNSRGAAGVGNNTAVARADQPRAVADASAANGDNNVATSIAEGCIGAPGRACAFSVSGNGNRNVATATSHGSDSKAQAGALDGDRNTALVAARDGGRAVANAQSGDDNIADSAAHGEKSFASAQSSGSGSFALARATGANSAANANAQKGGTARALAESGGSASANATGNAFTATAYASGAGASASASHDADTDTGNCSGPGVSFAMTGGKFYCAQGF